MIAGYLYIVLTYPEYCYVVLYKAEGTLYNGLYGKVTPFFRLQAQRVACVQRPPPLSRDLVCKEAQKGPTEINFMIVKTF